MSWTAFLECHWKLLQSMNREVRTFMLKMYGGKEVTGDFFTPLGRSSGGPTEFYLGVQDNGTTCWFPEDNFVIKKVTTGATSPSSSPYPREEKTKEYEEKL